MAFRCQAAGWDGYFLSTRLPQKIQVGIFYPHHGSPVLGFFEIEIEIEIGIGIGIATEFFRFRFR
jgi:hypothetical protein